MSVDYEQEDHMNNQLRNILEEQSDATHNTREEDVSFA
jgi:hypothetical protein